jgi:Concanavalin A-like lectin/glucanases superfamily/Calx-beta domain
MKHQVTRQQPWMRKHEFALRQTWVGLLAGLALLSAAPVGADCVPPPAGLVSWWPADGNANDLVGTNHGSLQGGATFAPGPVAQAFVTDPGYVRVPTSASLNLTGNFTIEAWIYPEADQSGGILGKWGDSGNYANQRAYLLRYLAGGSLDFRISDDAHQNDASFHNCSTPAGTVSLSKWSHVAAVYNQATGTRQVYVDGVVKASRTDAPITITRSIADLAIGAFLTSSTSAVQLFRGRLDEVSFYSRALTTSEVQAIYDAGAAGKCRPPALPVLSAGNVSVTESQNGTVAAEFSVTLDSASSQTVTVNYTTADGTANAPADYTATVGTLSLAPGQTLKTVVVTVKDDALDEAVETFMLNLSNAHNATLGPSQGTASIVDNDAAPALSLNNVTVAEGDPAPGAPTTTNAIFTATLSQASGQMVTVNFATADGTATAPGDYTAQSGTLAFNPGQTSRTIPVPVVDDDVFEASQNFKLTLTAPQHATLADAQGVVTITDNDAPPRISNAPDVLEGDDKATRATFLLILTGRSEQTASVNFATADNTALARFDYVPRAGSTTFLPGQTKKPLTVVIKGDTLNEPIENFKVNLSHPVNATLERGEARVRILDNDPTPTLAVADVTTPEGDTDRHSVLLTVRLSAASAYIVSVDYATADGKARDGSDYVARTGNVIFMPGETEKMIPVPILGDAIVETDEAFAFTLSNPIHATLSHGHAVVTITNDDASS